MAITPLWEGFENTSRVPPGGMMYKHPRVITTFFHLSPLYTSGEGIPLIPSDMLLMFLIVPTTKSAFYSGASKSALYFGTVIYVMYTAYICVQ